MKKKGFTLIELIGVLVVIAVISIIATPLVMNIIRNSKESSRKRSIDNYGKAIELAVTSYLLDNGKFPTDVSQLNIEYSGSKVECGVEYINDDNSIYLEECKVNDRLVENYTYGKDGRPASLRLISQSNPIEITNYNDGNKGEMYTFDHEATEQTPALTDYRYIGNVPNNYVSFNNGETWRIIGVFDTDDGTGKYEKRIKLIRDESLKRMKWDINRFNEWIDSTVHQYLNNEYKLSIKSQNLIKNTKYYLGEMNTIPNGEQIYINERGKNTHNDREFSYIGEIGLMYPSDYVYTYSLKVNDKCYNNPNWCSDENSKTGWLYLESYHEWTMISYLSNDSYVYHIGIQGHLGYQNNSDWAFDIRPVLYLKPEVKIKQGDGSIDNPYIFEL